jgi:5-deoxy-glucuronate isomerase
MIQDKKYPLLSRPSATTGIYQVVVEVYTPSGNWSSYPPHKHDTHRQNSSGEVIEACLEEIYFYKIDRDDGYAIQHIYTDDRNIDELTIAHNNDVIIVPAGYHPVAAAHGYNVYYLNFLAGSAQSLANFDDPAHSWIKNTWKKKDPRLPIVTLEMEK